MPVTSTEDDAVASTLIGSVAIVVFEKIAPGCRSNIGERAREAGAVVVPMNIAYLAAPLTDDAWWYVLAGTSQQIAMQLWWAGSGPSPHRG